MIEVDSEEVFYRYKYLPFNEGSLKVITEGTVKFTCPLEFNDPFDCQPVAYIDKQVRKKDYFKWFESQMAHLSPAKRVQEINRLYRRLSNGVLSGDMLNLNLRTMGVLSLSRTCNDILMWSHYAEHHKGFVVGFHYKDFDSPSYDKGIAHILPHKVDYKEDRPVFNFAKSHEFINCLLVKNPQWEYEQEERAFTFNQGPGIHKYDKQNRLYSVIAGAKMDPKELQTLKNTVIKASDELGREIKFKQAKLSDKSFSIDINDVKLKKK
ncbi:DUF2971 domain-containing protein [Aeromonas caviae]|uniref:DUF2971 domain-containing protein n=1 Tax=Aeromonas caviae TaxID=648 RepID=UPI002E7BACEC|nr:DUF2971 domain-containing protein [Aeromonas caviae]MEE1914724.1 DUF2971 domain-containing protein [Aeromonas caviae]